MMTETPGHINIDANGVPIVKAPRARPLAKALQEISDRLTSMHNRLALIEKRLEALQPKPSLFARFLVRIGL